MLVVAQPLTAKAAKSERRARQRRRIIVRMGTLRFVGARVLVSPTKWVALDNAIASSDPAKLTTLSAQLAASKDTLAAAAVIAADCQRAAASHSVSFALTPKT